MILCYWTIIWARNSRLNGVNDNFVYIKQQMTTKCQLWAKMSIIKRLINKEIGTVH